MGAEQRVDCELTVVIPCLNEASTVGDCVTLAVETMAKHGIQGEVLVADNGSTDGSPEIASRAGARVETIHARGYGSALRGGIAAARGRYVLMGDADCSYDFADIPRFVEKLRNGAELVQGCRMPAGGGTIIPGAMPFLHRWLGNPFFSMLARRFFQAPIHDINCGMRAFSVQHFKRLDQRCDGMEFAVEMVLKSVLHKAKIDEVPITLHKDRRNGRPHLKTFRDGWRTLRFFLMCSPVWLFFAPGAALIFLGVIGYAISLSDVNFGGVNFGVNTLVVSTMLILTGYQSIIFSVLAKQFAATEGLFPDTPRFRQRMNIFTVERGLLAAAASILVGFSALVALTQEWRMVNFGSLDTLKSLRVSIPAVLAICIGVQTVFASFFLGILGMQRSRTRE